MNKCFTINTSDDPGSSSSDMQTLEFYSKTNKFLQIDYE